MTTTSCASCCGIPGCEDPLIQSQHVYFRPCYFTDDVDGCLKKYRTGNASTSYTNSYSYTSQGFTTYSYFIDYTISRVDTYDSLTTSKTSGVLCDMTSVCTVSGTETIRDYFVIGSNSGPQGQYVITGTCLKSTLDGTLSSWDGQPDPTWSPSAGQTENDRPILPTCSNIWTKTISYYTPIYAENGVDITGSTLSSTVTIYIKETTSPYPYDSYSDEVSCSDIRQSIQSPSFDEVAISNGSPQSFYSCSECNEDPFYDPQSPSSVHIATYSRYQWVVPPSHEGSYYRIDWDEVSYPKSFLDWQSNPVGAPPELPTLTPKSWVWTGAALGPCCGDPPDGYWDRFNDPTRRSPWGMMAPPTSSGIVTIRNVRVLCYRSPFVSLPWFSYNYPTFSLDDLNGNGIPDVDE